MKLLKRLLSTSKIICWVIGTIFFPGRSNSQNWVNVGSGFNYPVERFFVDANTLYAMGNFDKSEDVPIDFIAKWNSTFWDSISGVNQLRVNVIFSYQGQLIAGGGPVYRFNGNTWDNIAKFRWGGVSGFTIYNNDLIAYGSYDSIGGIRTSGIAKWNGTAWRAFDTTTWCCAGIFCAAVYQGDLYIGGNMGNYNDSMKRLAKWNGSKWEPVGNGIRGGQAFVFDMVVFNGSLYVGGVFEKSDGNPGNGIARWDGSQWYDVGGGVTSPNGGFKDLQVFNNELYACGGFQSVGGIPAQSIAKWNGTEWCSLGSEFGDPDPLMSGMAVYNNELYVGGGFRYIDGDTVNYVAKWVGGNYADSCGVITDLNKTYNESFQLNINPNPASNHLHCISYSEIYNAFIQIYSFEGKLIMDNLAVLKKDFKIDVSAFSPGLYFLVLQDEKQRVVKKFVKE